MGGVRPLMQNPSEIRKVGEFFDSIKIDLPEQAGVYAFWWIGDKADLLEGNRHIVLKGPKEQPVDVYYGDWWPEDLTYPCLYVGKSTNIKKRFSLHIKRGCEKRLHPALAGNIKAKPATTSCQLRFGIEHVFRDLETPLPLIYEKVGFSYSTDFDENAIAERFFEEDRLVGIWRPWFNIDSER